jgi:endonuclease/exonuclease/phosphatase family metal-dependent hydrolase
MPAPAIARLVTLNLQGLGGGWFDGRFAAVTAGLAACHPDVVCFQETTVRHADTLEGGKRLYHQALAIGEAIGLPHVAFAPYGNPVEVMSADQGGVAIVARWPFTDVRNRRLPSPSHHPPDSRVALLATVCTPFGPLEVVTTHLSWRPEHVEIRLVQMGIVMDELGRAECCAPGARAVLLGDLNATDDEPCIELCAERLRDAWVEARPDDPGYTWVSSNPHVRGYEAPDRRLDYAFVPRGVGIGAAELVLRHAEPVQPSDHFGLLVELSWPEPPAA